MAAAIACSATYCTVCTWGCHVTPPGPPVIPPVMLPAQGSPHSQSSLFLTLPPPPSPHRLPFEVSAPPAAHSSTPQHPRTHRRPRARRTTPSDSTVAHTLRRDTTAHTTHTRTTRTPHTTYTTHIQHTHTHNEPVPPHPTQHTNHKPIN